MVLVIAGAIFSVDAQTVTFNAPFKSVSQTSVTYGQGIVADANSNLYITGTVNLLFLQRNPNGTYTPESTKIDSVGGTAYGLAIDAANNLYRPDIAPGSNPYLAKYIYQGVNTFTKAPIGAWTTSNSPSSVAVDSNYNVYVLDAGSSSVTTGSLIKLTPGSPCSSNIPACTTYTQTTLLTDTRLHSTTGLSMDSVGNFYVTSGSSTGDTPTKLSNSTEAVYKLIPSGGTYSFNTLSSGWSSPAATAIDSLGNIWVADYGAQKIYQLVAQSSSPTETNYTKIEFQSATNFVCLRTLTVSKTGQLFGLETGGSGCNSTAIPEVGGTAPHNMGSPGLGIPSTQEVDVSFPTSQSSVNYSVVTQGSAAGEFSDATPSSGSTSGGTPYCTEGTSSGNTCAIIAEFTPTTPGLQTGALLIKNSSDEVIGTNYLYGVGYGSEAALMPGGISTYATPSLTGPVAEAVDGTANLYVADPVSNLVVKITPGGNVSTVAGTGYPSNVSDPGCGGGAAAITINFTPIGVAIDGAGNLYFSDLNQDRVCAVNLLTGVLSTVAGTGTGCSSPTAACGDGGAATSAQLALGSLSGLAVDELGSLLIADSNDNRIRSVNLNTGVITTVAGSGTACPTSTATCGDGGQATASGAYLNDPTAIAVNAAGDYLIADMNDNRVRKVSGLTSVISTVAGDGTAGLSGDGALATAAALNGPTGVAADAAGDIYIADWGNSLIRMVTAGNGDIMTVAGGGANAATSTSISATNASFQHAAGIAVDSQGSLYVADTEDGHIDKVNSSAITLTFPTTTTVSTTDNTDGPLSVSLMNIGNMTLTPGSPAFSAPMDFQQVTGDTTDCSSTFSLGAGVNCNVRVQFVPQASGSLSESFVIADNSLGGNPSTQTITLAGTGASLAPTITLSPSTLPTETVGVAFSLYLAASGGTSPYTYAITGGSLPVGLTFSSGGVLSGTPMSAGGSFSFSVTATDSSSAGQGGPFTGSASYVLTINQGSTTVTLGNLAQAYTGSPLSATATTSPAGLTVNLTYNGSTTVPTAVGSYAVVATINDANYQGTATGALVIGKAAATVTLGNLAPAYTGSPLPATATTSPAGLMVSLTYNGSANVPTAAGSYAVVATINNTNYQGTATGTLVIGKAASTVTLGNLAQAYTGSPLPAAATTSPAGLTVNLTYNGSATVPTVAGSYVVVATINDANYQGTATGTLVIGKAAATVTLGNLAQAYTASPLSATATTSPAGLTVNLTYNGSATVPTAAGNYVVVATINDANYEGTATGTLVIGKAAATVTFGNLAPAYTGSPLPGTATTSPAGLTVNLTYNGSATVPTAAGSYVVVATINNANYQGTATGALVIGKTAAPVTLSNLAQTYTGSPLPATATTSPAGLTVNLTYNGSATVPTAVGSYVVVATINDANYQGTATGTLVIGKAAAPVTLGNLAQAYTGSPLPATATTSPTGLTVNLTYNGSATVPTAAGSYVVVATINNANYQGTATGTLVIGKTAATVTLGNLAQAYTGSPLPATATTSPAGLTVNLTYNGSATVPTAVGSYVAVATINNANYLGTATGTLVIGKAAATVTLGNLAQAYTGSPLPATATTGPAGLAVSLAYNGSATVPTVAGSYVVVATVNDTNYQGTATGTLVIGKAAATVTLGNLAPAYTGSSLSATATTSPAGLTVTLTYNGSATVPTAVGSYAVVATINDTSDQGTATGTLVIGKAAATVTLGNLAPAYTGSSLSATATTSPAGLPVNLTYNGNATVPTVAGSYAVVATINDTNYQGTATGNLTIRQQKPSMQWAMPAPITYGTALTAAQLDATSSVAGSFTFNPSAGTVLGGGANQTLSVTFTPENTANFSSATQSVLIAVNQAAAAASISSNANPSFSQSAASFTVTVSSTAGTPTGSVTFLDGKTPLGMSTLSTGAATFTIASLSIGTHSITAVYNGDANFIGTASGTLAQNVIDFGVSSGPGGGTNGGSSSSGNPTETVSPGGTATYTISIAPTAGTTFPTATLLTVTGLPQGVTATLTTAGWSQTTSTSWSLPAKASLKDVSLSFQVPGASASLGLPERPGSSNRMPALALCLLVLPFARRLRRVGKRLNRMTTLLMVLAIIGLSGCGARNGFFAQQQQTYNVTVTISTGALSHSTSLTLTVE